MTHQIGPFTNMDEYDATGLADLVRRGEVTSTELVETTIRRIEAQDDRLNAVVIRDFEAAMNAAARPPTGPFSGVPWLAKNLHSAWRGLPSTNSVGFMRDAVHEADSWLSERVRRAGFIVLGKTNVPEWGWSLSTEPAMYGPTLNPRDPTLTAGGSSGGAGTAVAAGYLPLAEASDGAGSTRAPAAIHGLYGLKPSRGRVPLGPDIADFWHGGGQSLCLGRSLRDVAGYLAAVEGGAPGEPYFRADLDDCLGALSALFVPLRIGFSTHNPRGDQNAPAVDAAVRAVAAILESKGHHVTEFAFDYDFKETWGAYTDVIGVENAGQFDMLERRLLGRPLAESDLSPTVWTSVQRGRATSGIEHARDIGRLRLQSRNIASLLAPYDVAILPVLPQGTRPVGFYDMSQDIESYNAGPMGEDNPYLMPFNISGLPALTVPAGTDDRHQPLGVQLVAAPMRDAILFQVARQVALDAE